MLKKKLGRNILILSIIIILFCPATIHGEQRVTVTGRANILNDNISRARDEALQDAYSRAVEKAIGAYISKSTLVDNLQVIENEIYSHAEGFVTDYEVLEEYRDGNIYLMQLETTVTSSLGKSLIDLEFVLKTQTSNPRILLLFDNNDQSTTHLRTHLEEVFSEIGFEIIMPENDNIEVDEENQEEAISVASDYDTELILLVDLTVENISEREISSDTIQVMRGQCDIRVISSKNGRIISALSRTEKAYSSSTSTAQKLVMEKLATATGSDLALDIIEELNRNSGENHITLEIHDISKYNNLMQLEDEISNIRGVKNKYLRTFSSGFAQYDLTVSQSSENIARKLTDNSKFKMNIEEIHADQIKIRILYMK
ncbi:MAG: flagellar assembly protein T N-terminal domain-containing protein [Halanaerobiaceae bacterium]